MLSPRAWASSRAGGRGVQGLGAAPHLPLNESLHGVLVSCGRTESRVLLYYIQQAGSGLEKQYYLSSKANPDRNN